MLYLSIKMNGKEQDMECLPFIKDNNGLYISNTAISDNKNIKIKYKDTGKTDGPYYIPGYDLIRKL